MALNIKLTKSSYLNNSWWQQTLGSWLPWILFYWRNLVKMFYLMFYLIKNNKRNICLLLHWNLDLKPHGVFFFSSCILDIWVSRCHWMQQQSHADKIRLKQSLVHVFLFILLKYCMYKLKFKTSKVQEKNNK